jgi:hypothetical protein
MYYSIPQSKMILRRRGGVNRSVHPYVRIYDDAANKESALIEEWNKISLVEANELTFSFLAFNIKKV